MSIFIKEKIIKGGSNKWKKKKKLNVMFEFDVFPPYSDKLVWKHPSKAPYMDTKVHNRKWDSFGEKKIYTGMNTLYILKNLKGRKFFIFEDYTYEGQRFIYMFGAEDIKYPAPFVNWNEYDENTKNSPRFFSTIEKGYSINAYNNIPFTMSIGKIVIKNNKIKKIYSPIEMPIKKYNSIKSNKLYLCTEHEHNHDETLSYEDDTYDCTLIYFRIKNSRINFHNDRSNIDIYIQLPKKKEKIDSNTNILLYYKSLSGKNDRVGIDGALQMIALRQESFFNNIKNIKI